KVLKKIGEASDGRVRAFYDESSKQVVVETTRTGKYNDNGNEIIFENSFFTETLKLGEAPSSSAQNATFTYNDGLTIESKNNSYSINGIHFEFNNVTNGNARITVSTNVDEAFDTISNFVEKYNEAIDM